MKRENKDFGSRFAIQKKTFDRVHGRASIPLGFLLLLFLYSWASKKIR